MDYCLSQDLGKVQDYHATILTEVRMQTRSRTEFSRKIYQPGDTEVMYPHILMVGADRSQLSYDKLIQETKVRLGDPRIIHNCYHVVDATGVGQAVIDLMRAERLDPVGIYITAGDRVSKKEYGFTVPKNELIATFQTVLSRDLLKMSNHIKKDVKDQFRHEIKNFKEKTTKAGNTAFESWREEDHDDLIMSLMMNCWYVLQMCGHSVTIDRTKKRKNDYNPLHDNL